LKELAVFPIHKDGFPQSQARYNVLGIYDYGKDKSIKKKLLPTSSSWNITYKQARW